MSTLDGVSSYSHVHVCDWIHNVLIIMLFSDSVKWCGKEFFIIVLVNNVSETRRNFERLLGRLHKRLLSARGACR